MLREAEKEIPQGSLFYWLSMFNLNLGKRDTMEALILALLIVRAAYRRRESVVPEPDTFQPFDLQALGHQYNADYKAPNPPSAPEESCVAHAV